MIIVHPVEDLMSSSMILLKAALLTAAFIVIQSAHGPVRACEDTVSAPQAPLAQTDPPADQRTPSRDSWVQLQQNVPSEIDGVTGDGQQASVSTASVNCVDRNAGCAQ
jgi:hypothetical protein